MRKIYAMLLVLLLSQGVLAQQDTTFLKEVVISATRTQEEVFETSRTVTVIDQEEIRENSFLSVADLLARQSALYVVGQGQTPGSVQSVFLRGSNSNHTNILIDGVKVSDPSTPNGAMDLSELSLANVERIEIVKGSHGAAYGTGGIGGVINIITKKGQEGLHGDLSTQAGVIHDGGYNLINQGFINYGKNGFYINGSILQQQVNGIDASRDTISDASFKTTDEDKFTKLDYSTRVGYQSERFEIFGALKSINQQADIDDGAFDDDENYTIDFDRTLIQYGGAYTLNDWKLTYNGGFTKSNRLVVDDSSRVDTNGNFDQTYVSNESEGQLLTNELQLSYHTPSLSAVVGGGIYNEDMDFKSYIYLNSAFGLYEQESNYDTLDMSLDTKYLFSNVHIDFGKMSESLKGINLTVAGRYSDIGSTDNFSFEVSPAYIFKQSNIYFSYSTGFNAPALIQQFDPNGQFNFTTRGNPNLDPETSRSIEVGIKQMIGNRISLSAAYFNTKVKDAIEYVYLWNGQTAQADLSFFDYLGDTYVNIAEQQVQGVELSAELILSDKWRMNLNGSYLEGKFSYSPDDIDQQYVGDNHVQLFANGLFINQVEESKDLVRRPSLQGFAQLTFKPVLAWSLSANLRYTDSRPDSFYDPSLGPFGALNAAPVEGYTLIDLSANYQVSEKLNTGLFINNILNTDYSEINGFNTRGRTILVKVGYTF